MIDVERNDVKRIAERLREEPFNMLMNNCILKSFRFRKACKKIGVDARVVIALVVVPNEKFPLLPYVLWFHGWAKIDGHRIELARPLDELNSCGTLDSDIMPIVELW